MLTTALCALFVSLVFAKDNEIVLQVKPEILVNTLKALRSSGYFQKLADEFAMKTAEQFLKQLKKEQKSLPSQREHLDTSFKLSLPSPTSEKLRQRPSPGLVESHPNFDRKVNDDHIKWKMSSASKEQSGEVASSEERRSQQLLALMETPPPDGDNLDSESILTEVEEPKTDNPINFYKINGRHYRRYDLFWK